MLCTAALDAQFKVTLQNIRYILELGPHMGVVWIAFLKKEKKKKIRIVLFKTSLKDRTHIGSSSLNITLVSLHFV